MASSSIRKQCANNDGCKQTAITNCEGCSKAFCIKHFGDHRRLLDEEMNVIINEHDHLRNTLNQQTIKLDPNTFIKAIDQWEKESIEKIQKRANELREELLQVVTNDEDELSKRFQQLSAKLKESRENDNFIETDLQDWKKTLYNLKTDLTSSSMISINRLDNAPLAHNISISLSKMARDLFERVSDNAVRIEEKGQVIVRDGRQDTTEVRGKNEYISGRYEIRLRIEQSSGGWMFLGINWKGTPLQNRLLGSKSSHGWSSNNNIWLNGISQVNKSNSPIEMKINDIITLIFDCDKHQISIINEGTKIKHDLTVNINTCPFPWQLQVNLYEPNSRVRLF